MQCPLPYNPYITIERIGEDFTFTSSSMFVILVCHFPNLSTLLFKWLTSEPGEGSVQPLSLPLVGKICFGYAGLYCLEFLDSLGTKMLTVSTIQPSHRPCLSAKEWWLSLKPSLATGVGIFPSQKSQNITRCFFPRHGRGTTLSL